MNTTKNYDILNGFGTVINEAEAASEDDAIVAYAARVSVPIQKLIDAGYSARVSSFQTPARFKTPSPLENMERRL